MHAGLQDTGRSHAPSLLQRYRAVLVQAWRDRINFDDPARNADERAFLAPTLSLQETPPHPLPRMAARLLCALFAVAVAWACFGQLDVVAIAPGRIIVGERSKIIQPLDPGVVRAIHVRDGDRVKQGQLLIELDPTNAQADTNRIAEERRAAQAATERAQALLEVFESDRRPRMASSGLADSMASDRSSLESQLEAEWLEHRARLERHEAEHRRRTAELATARQIVAKLEATLPIVQRRDADFEQLTKQGFVSGHSSQDRARERIEIERDLATARARIHEADAALAETVRSRAAYRAEIRRVWHDRAAQGRIKLAELAQERSKVERRHEQTRLEAPVAGTVQQLAIHTSGGVVTPAQALMVIVPDAGDEPLVAEVSVENKDIGHIRDGQPAEVKLETFSYTRYGTVAATVQWVTADAVIQSSGPDSARRTEAVFPARLRLAQHSVDIDGRNVRLTPGMNITAEVKIGRRRVIDYLLSPLQQRASESLRER
jgi:hemolysin D